MNSSSELFDMSPKETYAYAIDSSFTVKVSLPAALKNLSYRPHKYFNEEKVKTVQGEIRLYNNRKLVGTHVIKVDQDRLDYYEWRDLKVPPEQEVNEIEFPRGFDFDNIHLTFIVKRVWEVAKLDYLKRLLDYGNAESHTKALKESFIDKAALKEIARELAEKLFAYDVNSIDLQQLLKVKDEDDKVSVELVQEINNILKEKQRQKGEV